MPRPSPRRLPALVLVLVLALWGSLAGTAALATTDPDDPPPLTPVRDPAPVEPQPRQVVLARAAGRDPAPGALHAPAPVNARRPEWGQAPRQGGRSDRRGEELLNAARESRYYRQPVHPPPGPS